MKEALLLPIDLPFAVGDDIDFGGGVALNHDTLFVGAPKAGSANEGRVYVYTRAGLDWVFDQELAVGLPGATNSAFGRTLDADDGLLAVGCQGSVVLFRETAGVWQQEAQLDLAPGDLVGVDQVAVSGDSVAALDDTILGDGGGVTTFRNTSGVWAFEQFIAPIPGERGFIDVELVDGSLMLGSYNSYVEGDETVVTETRLRIYEQVGGVWTSGAPMDGGLSIQASADRVVTTGRETTSNISIPFSSTTYHLIVIERIDGRWEADALSPSPDLGVSRAVLADDLLLAVGGNEGAGSPTVARLVSFAQSEGGEWSQLESELITPFIGLPGGPLGLSTPMPWELVAHGAHAALADASFGGGFPPDGGAFVFRGTPFGSIESGSLAGDGGIAPTLTGSGLLTPGSTNSVTLSGALPSTTSALLSGLGLAELPFKGGVLVPTPNLIFNGLLALPVNAQGEQTLSFTWPADVPAGTKLYVQQWVVDPAGPLGFSASNGLELVGQ